VAVKVEVATLAGIADHSIETTQEVAWRHRDHPSASPACGCAWMPCCHIDYNGINSQIFFRYRALLIIKGFRYKREHH